MSFTAPLRVLALHAPADAAPSRLSTDAAVTPVACDPAGAEIRDHTGTLMRARLDRHDLVWVDPSVLGPAGKAGPALIALLCGAEALGVPVHSSAQIASGPLELTVETAPDLDAAIRQALDASAGRAPCGGLRGLQRYYGRMALLRDYGADHPEKTMLLLTEEVGELANAIRKEVGIGRSHLFRSSVSVGEELADIQLYLLALANIMGCSLADAVAEKETLNQQRFAAERPLPSGLETPRYLAIEGLIGAGKTTTARQVATALGLEPLLERVEDHPFLERFYTDVQRYAVEVEITFILLRWHALRDRLAADRLVADFSPYKDMVFSSMLLTGLSAEIVHKLYDHFWQTAPRPTLTVFLDLDPAEALARIARRGRPYEQAIDMAYLQALRGAYLAGRDELGQNVVVLPVADDEPPEQVAERVIAVAEGHGFSGTAGQRTDR